MEKVIDFTQALEQLDGDVELLQEVVEIFMERAPALLDQLESAISSGDPHDVTIHAHGLKGGAANFCGVRFCGTALELELLGRDGSLSGAEDLLERMRNQYEELEQLLEEIDWSELESAQPSR